MNSFTAKYCATPQARKKWMIFGGIGVFILVLIIIIVAVTSGGGDGAEFRGRDVLIRTPLIEGYNSFPNLIYTDNENSLGNLDFKNLPDKLKGPTDLNTLHAGKVAGVFWSAFADCSTINKDAVERTMDQIDIIKRLIQMNPELKLAKSHDDIINAFHEGKIASLISVNGGHSIDARLGVLRLYYELGVRSMAFTADACAQQWASSYTENNVADADADGTDKGLSTWGEEVVKEMNRLGMIIDLTHASFETVQKVLEVTKAPVIFSHSATFEQESLPYNIKKDIYDAVKTTKSVVMLNLDATALAGNDAASVEEVVKHLVELKKIGIDNIGIGGNFKDNGVAGYDINDQSKYLDLFDQLYQGVGNYARWSETDLRKLAGDNLLNLFKEVEKVRNELASTTKPVETAISYEELIDFKDFEEYGCRSDLREPSNTDDNDNQNDNENTNGENETEGKEDETEGKEDETEGKEDETEGKEEENPEIES